MKEPFLSAVITDESEPAIANKPLDSAVWHRASPCVYNISKIQRPDGSIQLRTSIGRGALAVYNAGRPYRNRQGLRTGGCMGTARLTTIASAAVVLVAAAIVMAQAPGGQGRGGQGRGAGAGAPPAQLPGGAPPAPADPSQLQGQGRGG